MSDVVSLVLPACRGQSRSRGHASSAYASGDGRGMRWLTSSGFGTACRGLLLAPGRFGELAEFAAYGDFLDVGRVKRAAPFEKLGMPLVRRIGNRREKVRIAPSAPDVFGRTA